MFLSLFLVILQYFAFLKKKTFFSCPSNAHACLTLCKIVKNDQLDLIWFPPLCKPLKLIHPIACLYMCRRLRKITFGKRSLRSRFEMFLYDNSFIFSVQNPFRQLSMFASNKLVCFQNRIWWCYVRNISGRGSIYDVKSSFSFPLLETTTTFLFI